MASFKNLEIANRGSGERPVGGAVIDPRLTHRVLVPLLLRVVGLPAAGGEDVLVLLVPAPQHHLASVGLETPGRKHREKNRDQ